MIQIPLYRRWTVMTSLAACLLSGCAGTQEPFPSLAIRDAERVQGTFEATPQQTPPAVPLPLNNDMTGRLAQLTAETTRAHRLFLDDAPGAIRLVNAASGSAIDSDRWASAQIALAELESSRSQAAVPLGDLDELYTDATLAFEQREAITIAREEVITMISEEDRILARLRGKMPSN